MTRIVYLHGFASSPLSTKATFFAARFSEIGVRSRFRSSTREF